MKNSDHQSSSEKDDDLRTAVRERYGSIARDSATSSQPQGCCGASNPCGSGADMSLKLGYSDDDLAAVPDGTNLGLGCGNPHAIAALKPGETVLDLGAGAGFDCFLAASQVGPTGRVIGVDMTPDMVIRARRNASKVERSNVEFRLGEIEHLPVADNSVDVILSNCVINLSPNKEAVFSDALRVLKPGGRLAISDVVAVKPLPVHLANDIGAMTGCLNSIPVADFEQLLKNAGFENISIVVNNASREFIREWAPGTGVEDYVASATIEANKPGKTSCCGPTCCDSEAPA